MNQRVLVAVALLCSSWPCVAVAQNMAKSSPKAAKAKPNPSTPNPASEGERLFNVNCARCHNPPEDISPREATAVVRHMRVRAMLSAEEEKLIRQFIAP